MDPLMALAERAGVKVIEDASHAHGALYKGRPVGTLGHAAAFSLMSGKSLATGEGGILVTDDRLIYERAILFGHYERHGTLTLPDVAAGAGLPWGGQKYRMHQLTSAVGRVQLRNYPAQMAEIDAAMTAFWDLLEGVPGLRPHRPPKGSGTTMGGWYAATGHYRPEELGGLSVARFCAALTAEGIPSRPGVNRPLHLHALFHDVDVYGDGRPTRTAFLGEDAERPAESLPVTEAVPGRTFSVPWFKKLSRPAIEEHAAAIRKVAASYRDLLPGDEAADACGGVWGLSSARGGAR
jgi:dTDP-4-amino-4,6-dideoxygalactose transaminase